MGHGAGQVVRRVQQVPCEALDGEGAGVIGLPLRPALGMGEVPRGPLLRHGPAGGQDAGLAAQRHHGQAAVVGNGHQAGCVRRGPCLQHRIADEGGLGLVRLGQAQRARRHGFKPSVQQGGDLPRLAGIMGRRHQSLARSQHQHIMSQV